MNNININNKDQLLIKKLEELKIEIVNIANREVSCKCPKHEDSNPSFFFNLDTQAFHCFAGCIKGHGMHQLIFQLTGVSVAGNPMQEPVLRKFEYNREQAKKIIPSIPFLPLALNNKGGDYLINRGFTIDTINNWKLQYWAEENAVVIPLEDKGYTLRYLDKNAPKKYKYITGTKISETLFGISRLPKTLTSIILVEGSFDCIYLHQIGFSNSLALLHADISREQIKRLGGLTDYVNIMLDGDKAGRVAAEKIKLLLGSRFIKKICILPEGKDPDNLSKEEVDKILKDAK